MENIVFKYDDIKPTFCGVYINWKFQNYSYVKKGDILCTVSYEKMYVISKFFSSKTELKEIKYDIKSPCDGYLYIRDQQELTYNEEKKMYYPVIYTNSDLNDDNDNLFEYEIDNFEYDNMHIRDLTTDDLDAQKPIASICDSLDDIFSIKYSHSGSELIIDPFDKTKEILLKNNLVLTPPHDDHLFSLGFSNDTAFFYFYDYSLNTRNELRKGDSILLLFESGDIINFVLSDSPLRNEYRYENTKISHYEYRAAFPLYREDVDLLTNSNLVSYRIKYHESHTKPETLVVDDYPYKKEEFRAYINEFLKTLRELVHEYHLPYRTVKQTQGEYTFNECYVYLMRDNINGYYKIGMSNNPEYREKTLQSEKPSIELIAPKKYPTRKIAESIESALHKAYDNLRLRGEWFNLKDEDVAAVIETLK